MPISESIENVGSTGEKLTSTKVSACIQPKEPSLNGNASLRNTEIAIQKSIKVTQAMKIFLTSLRDDLKAKPLPQDSLNVGEQVRKGRDVTDKLTHAYYGFKTSVTEIVRPIQVKKMKLSTNSDGPRTSHVPPVEKSSTEVTACEVIELSEESSDE